MAHTTLFSRKLTGNLGLLLTVGIILSQPAYSSAADSSSLDDSVLIRVDEDHGNGVIRSHLEYQDGTPYTEETTSEKQASIFQKGVDAASLPSKYDLRDYNLTTSIKDQGLTGCCWAFAAVKAVESNCIKLGLLSPEQADFSESHLAWFSYNPSADRSDPLYGDGIRVIGMTPSGIPDSSLGSYATAATFPYVNGGSAILASFTLSKWAGLTPESDAPFQADDQSSLDNMANSMYERENLRYTSSAHLQNAYGIDDYMVEKEYYYEHPEMIPKMKQAILDNGAMSVAFYFAKSYVSTSDNGTSYYQTRYSGSQAVEEGNHCVTIVGWDDNYSRDNFSNRPPRDGAWLIANSYGTEFGDDGYFWLSYHDPSISECYVFQAESVNNYNHIYQYDGFGWDAVTYSDTRNIRAANIFTADSPQEIRAVSFYTLTKNQEYKIQVYRGVNSAPTNGMLVTESTTVGTAEYPGYHTIPLAVPAAVGEGENFSVVVTYVRPEPIASKVYVPLEGRGEYDNSLYMQYGSRKGQSFLYTKYNSNSTLKWIDTSAAGYNNVCVKAFTNDATGASAVPKVKTKITLGKGESFQLKGSADSYTSGDTALVSVTENGKLKGKAVGITTILVSNGDSSSLVRVNVKKAPSSVRFKPSGKKTIKKGKTFLLKVKLSSGSASRKLRFSSSNKRVAAVSASGKVKARRPGNTVIKVRTFNGKTAKLKLTVKK